MPNHKRVCYYCGTTATPGFYLQLHKAWSCVECYMSHYLPKYRPTIHKQAIHAA